MRMAVLQAFVAAVVGASAAGTPTPVGTQASLDCWRPASFVQSEICRLESLAARDRRIARLYAEQRAVWNEAGSAAPLLLLERRHQRWLAERAACRTTACLERAYDRRIAELEIAD